VAVVVGRPPIEAAHVTGLPCPMVVSSPSTSSWQVISVRLELMSWLCIVPLGKSSGCSMRMFVAPRCASNHHYSFTSNQNHFVAAQRKPWWRWSRPVVPQHHFLLPRRSRWRP
jgi:hypothetical protein